ncbi:MAG: sulfatase-like hydrolase/transferase [Eubacterium sp.]|nr:sulfatase-like hydrolase/transferase [Eubacterium sp.]
MNNKSAEETDAVTGDSDAVTGNPEEMTGDSEEESGNSEEATGNPEETKQVKPIKLWRIILLLVILFAATFFMAGAFWALSSWSSISTDELLWHLKTSLKGANTSMVWEFVLITVGSAILATGVAAFLLFWMRIRKSRAAGRRMFRIMQLFTGLVLMTGLVTAWIGFGVGDFLKNYMDPSAFIEENYVNPQKVKITFPEKKRNLIFIYLESMEVTYMDKENGGAFPENVIPELTELAKENECFAGNSGKINGGIALPGAIWTMGAVFGTTSGLPLKTPLGQNGMSMNSDFFPGLVTMGDILEGQGYQNRLLMGSGATFGGCRLYYGSHGNFAIHDYDYAIEVGRIPEDYFVWWGYEDAKLFEYAKEELTEMAKEGKPFQLAMQTMDTHFEDGHSCWNCRYTFGDNKYANVMNCSSRMVSSFVEWVQQQDFYENTTIIIAGDHPTMDKNFCEDVPETYQRKTYFCIINPAESVKAGTKERDYSTFDIYPTTLAALGVSIEGERLGLGTNLYSGQKTLLEQYGKDKMSLELEKRSKVMEDMFNGEYGTGK